MKNNPRGSTWKKCDLHFHTPLSFDHEYKAQTPEETVNKFKEEGVGIVAVTDHYFIDPEYIQALRDESEGEITFLPGVEFRSDVGDKAVHMIGIFSEEEDLERLSNELSALTKIYKADLTDKRKLETTYTKHEQLIEFIRDHSGLLSIHAGCGRSGSFETVGNDDWCLRTFKTEFLRDNVDLPPENWPTSSVNSMGHEGGRKWPSNDTPQNRSFSSSEKPTLSWLKERELLMSAVNWA